MCLCVYVCLQVIVDKENITNGYLSGNAAGALQNTPLPIQYYSHPRRRSTTIPVSDVTNHPSDVTNHPSDVTNYPSDVVNHLNNPRSFSGSSVEAKVTMASVAMFLTTNAVASNNRKVTVNNTVTTCPKTIANVVGSSVPTPTALNASVAVSIQRTPQEIEQQKQSALIARKKKDAQKRLAESRAAALALSKKL